MVAHYPAYAGSELSEGGYAGVTRVIVSGGTKKMVSAVETGESINVGRVKNPLIRITGADEVYLITKCSRTHNMGKFENLRRQRNMTFLMNYYPILKML